MKKCIKYLLQSTYITVALIATATTAYATNNNIYIDGILVESNVAPYNNNGYTLVPLRVIGEGMDCAVSYADETKTITVKKGSDVITLQPNNTIATVNGSKSYLDVSPKIKNGTTMVPLRNLSQLLNSSISYDSASGRIDVDTKTPPLPDTTARDGWGNKVRTTNLPANAKMFPYIREGVPNWAYERLAYAWNDNGWGPENNPARPANQRKLLDSPAELWNSPSGTKEIWSKEFIVGSSGKPHNTDECITWMIDAQLNVDYRKIDNIASGTLQNVINDTVSPYSMKNSDIKQALSFGGGYKQYAKENEVIISSEFTPLYEASWREYNNGEYVLMLPVLATVNFEHIKTGSYYDFYGHYNTNGMSDKDSVKSMKNGDKVTSIITYKLFHNPKTGQWQFWYGDMNPKYQINPSCNQYEGVSPNDRVGKYVGGWVYQWMKDEAKPLGRYQTDYDTDAIKKIFTQ